MMFEGCEAIIFCISERVVYSQYFKLSMVLLGTRVKFEESIVKYIFSHF